MADEAILKILLEEKEGGADLAAKTRVPPPPLPHHPQERPPAPGQRPPKPPGNETVPPPAPIPKMPPPPTKLPDTGAEKESGNRDWVNDLVKGIEGANRHVLLEGPSGSGKSLMARHIAFERMKQGEEVSVVDVHNPEAWGGAKQVFQGEQAGSDAAAFLRESLEARKREAQEAKMRGETPQFKDMTVVFSDFARLMKDTPKLGEEFRTLMTEARKFRISIIADTTALTGAASGIKGVQDVIQNFGQRVKLYGPTAERPERTAKIGEETFATPRLPSYQERIDYGLVKPYSPPAKEEEEKEEFDPRAEAMKRRESQQKRRQIDEAYQEMFGGAKQEKGGFDQFLDIAKQFRGTIGGKMGGMTGSALDMAEMFGKMRGGGAANSAGTAAKSAGAAAEGGMMGGAMEGAAAGGMMEMAGAAAGPAAIAIAAKLMIDKIGDAIAGGVKAVGSRLADMVTPGEKASVTMAKLGDATAKAGDKISWISPLFGQMIKVGGAAVEALGTLMQAFDAAAAKYAEYSPAAAQAQALVEVQQTMGDLRRAQEAGPELARYIRIQGEIQQKFEDMKVKLLTKLLELVNPILTILEAIMPTGQQAGIALDIMATALQAIAGPIALIAQINQELADMQRQPTPNDPTTVLFRGDGQNPPIAQLP